MTAPTVPRYATRRGAGWEVVDTATGEVVGTFGVGPAGARAATEAAALRNRHDPKTGATSEVRTWRKQHRLTQAQLAERLGVTPLCVIRWENGQRVPPAFLTLALQQLALSLG